MLAYICHHNFLQSECLCHMSLVEYDWSYCIERNAKEHKKNFSTHSRFYTTCSVCTRFFTHILIFVKQITYIFNSLPSFEKL